VHSTGRHERCGHGLNKAHAVFQEEVHQQATEENKGKQCESHHYGNFARACWRRLQASCAGVSCKLLALWLQRSVTQRAVNTPNGRGCAVGSSANSTLCACRTLVCCRACCAAIPILAVAEPGWRDCGSHHEDVGRERRRFAAPKDIGQVRSVARHYGATVLLAAVFLATHRVWGGRVS